MKINVLGSGYMGKQICSLFVVIGHNVKIWQNSRQNHEKLIQKEIIKIEKHFRIKAKGNYTFIRNIDELENDLTIETIKEDLILKKNIWQYFMKIIKK